MATERVHRPATEADVDLLRRAAGHLGQVVETPPSRSSLAGVPGRGGYWTAAVNVEVGRALAALFDRAAWMGRLDVDMLNRVPCDEVLALARAILGEDEGEISSGGGGESGDG